MGPEHVWPEGHWDWPVKLLAGFGATLEDVVKLNRYYVGSGTAAAWQEGALVAASFFTEPGPRRPGSRCRRSPTRG